MATTTICRHIGTAACPGLANCTHSVLLRDGIVRLLLATHGGHHTREREGEDRPHVSCLA
jgi:hypothetical protein